MARRAKGWLVTLGIIVIAVIAAIVVVPTLVPANALRDRLVAAVHDATGRDLAIKGGVSVSLLPRLALSAKEVSFSNAPWAGPQPMATLDDLEVRLKLLPLLSGEVAIDSFALRQPVINLATNKEGQGNWEFSPAAAPRPAPAQPAGQAKPTSLPAFALGKLQISDGRLMFTDGATGRQLQADDVNLNASYPGAGAPLEAEGSAKWNGKPVDLSLNVASLGGPAGAQGSPATVQLASDLLKLGYKGTLATGAAIRADGDLTLAVSSVHDLMRWLDSQATAPTAGPLNLTAHTAFAGQRLSLDNLLFTLDAIKGKGEVSVVTAEGAPPAVTGKLAFGHLDLSPYLPPEQPSSKPAASSASKGWSDQPIHAAGLKAADLDLVVSAASIAMHKLAIGESELRVHLKGGRLVADLVRMAAYQGEAKGRVSVDGSRPQLAVAANLSFDKVQVEPLMAALSEGKAVSGTASGESNLTTHGDSERALVAALDGKGHFAVTNGSIKGVNLTAMIHNAANAFTQSASESERTDFASLSGSYVIAHGTLTNRDLSLQASEMQLAGTGTANLLDRTLDYRLVPHLGGQKVGMSIPVLVHGSWDNLAYAPDLSGVAGQQLGEVGKELNSVLGGSKGGTSGQSQPNPPASSGKLPGGFTLPGLGR